MKKTQKSPANNLHNENQRIKALRKLLSATQQQFALTIGISQAALSDIENEKNGISYDVFKHIIDSYTVRPAWMMYGQGAPFEPVNPHLEQLNETFLEGAANPKSKASADAIKQGPASAAHQAGASLKSVPLILSLEEQQQYRQQYSDWKFLQDVPHISLPGLDQNVEYRAFQVHTEAMFPTMQVGDIVVCRVMQQKPSLQQGQVYVVLSPKDGLRVGRAAKNYEAGATSLHLLADNSAMHGIRIQRKQQLQLLHVECIISREIVPKQHFSDIMENLGKSLDEMKGAIARLSKD